MSNKVIEGFRLSPQQAHLWSLQQHADERAYRAQCVITIEGSLDLAALELALNKIISRHEILRTAFRSLPGMSLPLQVISNDTLLSLPLYDLSHEPLPQQGERLDLLLQEMNGRPVDLDNGVPLQVWLVKTAEKKHTLLMSISALCMDTVGLKNLFYELACDYANRSGDEELACEPMQYADFSDWQNEILTATETSAGRAHWQQHDFSDRGTLSLPLKKAFTETRSLELQSLRSMIETGILKTIEALASRYDVSLSSVLLASFQLLLWRLTQQTEVVTGVASSCRNYEELETALGLFARYLPLCSNFDKQPAFAELVREVEQQLKDAQQWQEFFNSGTDCPHLSFKYEFVDEDVEVVHPGEVQFKLVRAWANTDRSDVLLRCLRQTDGSLIAEWHYDARLYATGDIERLAAQWQTVLLGVSAYPEATAGAVSILDAEERVQLLVNFNQTSEAWINTLCLHELVETQVKRTPDAVAVEFDGQQLTYRELDQRANRLARLLRRKGVTADTRVAILIERSLEMVVGMLGILKASGAYVPLDTEYPIDRLALMLQDSGARIVVTQARLRSVLDAIATDQLEAVCLDTQEIDSESFQPLQHEVNLSSLAYVIYTSGSTGRPKGVMIPHEGICNRVLWIQQEFPLTEGDRLLQKTPISFDASVWEIFVPLISGARLVLAEPGGQRDCAYLVETIEKHQITTLQLVPSMLRVFLDEPNLSQCHHLRRVFCGGESLPVDLQQKFFARLKAELHNLYGPTETSIDATFRTCKVNDEQRGVLIGRPISNIQIYLLDSRLEPVPIGCSGELHVGGAGLARGYLNRPDLTADRFIPNPFSSEPGLRLYRTGDLARYLPDGTIEYLGRIDHQVKLRGFRIELGEVESALGELRAVKSVVVVVREDEPGQRRLVAYVVPENSLPLSVNELRSRLEQKLPEYMLPSTFVVLPELPRLPNGKIDRASLPAPDRAHSESQAGYVAPRNAVEETLQQIWQQVLGLTQIGVNDNFFELGGDSILSIQIVARAHQAGLKLSPKHIFRHQTITELSQVTKSAVAATLAQQGLATGRVSLTPIQRYFFEQNLAEPHHFNQSLLLAVRRRLTTTELQRVIEQLVLHHDALRLRFKRDEISGEWQQSYAGREAARQVCVEVIDLSNTSETASTLEARAQELQRGLNLEHGPLLRVALISMGPNQSQRLLIVIHHLAVDGVSWRILLDDLERGLSQSNGDESISSAPKTTSYGQWSERLAEYVQGTELHAELSYWSEIVRTASALPIPLDREDCERTLGSSRSLVQHLEIDETRALLQDVPAVYQTQINDVLLTALVEAIAKWSGERRIALEMEGHGREEISEDVDLSRTAGWFTSVYPVVLDVRDAANPGDALKQVKEQLRRILNGGIGYGVLRYLSDAAPLQTGTPIELSFNYLGQLDQVLDANSLFSGASESIGLQQSPQGRQRYALEVSAAVAQGKLHVRFTYNEHLHVRETIQQVMNDYMQALRELIVHCQADEAGGFTPSDFPLIQLDQQELDLALSEIDFG
jgi:amino acid adenylation domain-containing protein/non-ribosomal peptide synthase protein (TIGR01720 family)